jgi:hypothetical protein
MEKIRELLKQMGASDELSNKIMEELVAFKSQTEAGLAEEFKRRLEEAKKVCVEAVEQEKAEIRRKAEIFLESRINTIDREAQRQVAIGEAEATRKLKGVKSLVEGIQIGGKSGEDQAALAAENKKLRLKVSQLSEERVKLETKAERANSIAMKVLKRNKVLESAAVEPTKQMNESKNEPKPGKKETLESLRKPSATPTTTRPTLNESQTKSGQPSGDSDIDNIASQLDGTPAFVGSNQE